MWHAKTLLLSIGVVMAYCLAATLINCRAIRGDISKVILLAVLVFIWCMTIHPNRKYFS